MESHQNTNRQIARAAGTVAFAIVFGQLMGLARGMLATRIFPTSQLDAFYAANRVSETLFTLIAAGALGSAFLPTFTGFLVKDDRHSAWHLASSMANLVTLTLSLLAALVAVFAPQVVRYALAPGLAQDPALFKLTVDLLRIQLISAVVFGLGGLVIGILNAHQIFLVPQLTAGMYQLGQIFGILVLGRWMGIYGLAWGVVIGAVLFLLIQLPTLFRLKGNYTPTLGLDRPAVRNVLWLMSPRVLGAGVVQLNFWVNTLLASKMPESSITTLTLGFALMLMAQAAIAQSVAIAVMPTFSAQFALDKQDEMRASLAAALRGMLLLAIPASVGLILLRTPIVAMLYQRGEFGPQQVEMAAWALGWYAAGLIGHSVLEVLTRAFYARHDTWTPVGVGFLAMSLNVAFSIGFSAWFGQMGLMPHGGLALANSLATALEAAALFLLLRRQLGGIHGKEIVTGAAKFGLAALGMALALLVWIKFGTGMNRWIQGLGGVAVGGAVYGLGVVLLRVPEIRGILGAVRRRVQKP
jgi:putative peptidoglycan lipid II flippase